MTRTAKFYNRSALPATRTISSLPKAKKNALNYVRIGCAALVGVKTTPIVVSTPTAGTYWTRLMAVLIHSRMAQNFGLHLMTLKIFAIHQRLIRVCMRPNARKLVRLASAVWALASAVKQTSSTAFSLPLVISSGSLSSTLQSEARFQNPPAKKLRLARSVLPTASRVHMGRRIVTRLAPSGPAAGIRTGTASTRIQAFAWSTWYVLALVDYCR